MFWRIPQKSPNSLPQSNYTFPFVYGFISHISINFRVESLNFVEMFKFCFKQFITFCCPPCLVGESGHQKTEDRGKWRLKRGGSEGLKMAVLYAAQSYWSTWCCRACAFSRLPQLPSTPLSPFFFLRSSHVLTLHWSCETLWPSSFPYFSFYKMLFIGL